jgi:hypothetical protein
METPGCFLNNKIEIPTKHKIKIIKIKISIRTTPKRIN